MNPLRTPGRSNGAVEAARTAVEAARTAVREAITPRHTKPHHTCGGPCTVRAQEPEVLYWASNTSVVKFWLHHSTKRSGTFGFRK